MVPQTFALLLALLGYSLRVDGGTRSPGSKLEWKDLQHPLANDSASFFADRTAALPQSRFGTGDMYKQVEAREEKIAAGSIALLQDTFGRRKLVATLLVQLPTMLS